MKGRIIVVLIKLPASNNAEPGAPQAFGSAEEAWIMDPKPGVRVLRLPVKMKKTGGGKVS